MADVAVLGEDDRGDSGDGADLQLKPVCGASFGDGHDPGVVDEDVDRAFPAVGERAHRRQICEIERAHLGITGDLRGDPLAFLKVANGEDDMRAGAGEHAGGLQAEAAGGAGHHHHTARQVRYVS